MAMENPPVSDMFNYVQAIFRFSHESLYLWGHSGCYCYVRLPDGTAALVQDMARIGARAFGGPERVKVLEILQG